MCRYLGQFSITGSFRYQRLFIACFQPNWAKIFPKPSHYSDPHDEIFDRLHGFELMSFRRRILLKALMLFDLLVLGLSFALAAIPIPSHRRIFS